MDSSREYKYSVIKLIEAVKVRPVLWDSSRAEFRSHKNKDQVWQNVFEELDDNYRFLSEKERSVIVIKLIEAVKVRPELWDNSRAEFRSYKNKDRVWQDVFKELDDNYRFLSEKEQSEIAMKITTKWRNIRDVFIRSIKKRATDTKMKKYMYHDRLSFMLKLYKSYITPESPGPVQFDKPYNTYLKALHEHKAQRSISFDNIPESSLDEKPKTSNPAAAAVEEESRSIKTEPDDNDDEEDEELTNDGIEACSSSRNIVTDFDDEFDRTSCSEIQANQGSESGGVQQIQNRHHRQDIKPVEIGLNQSNSGRHFENVAILQADEDEAFLTSIMSSVRDMNLDEKLEFRIAVLQKISDIRSKRHNA